MLVAAIGLVIYLSLLVSTLLYAWARGGETERHFVVIWILNALASEGVALLGEDFTGFALRSFAIDFAVLIGLCWLSLKSDRYWPLWATAFQLVAFLTHFTKLMQPNLVRDVYGPLAQLWGFPILLSAIAGTWRATLHQSSQPPSKVGRSSSA